MSLSRQLLEALGTKEGSLCEAAEKVVLAAGQFVAVRTKRGNNVVKKGRITRVDKEVGVVRVLDIASGSTLEVDVDPKEYIVWVLPPPDTTTDRLNRIKKLFVRGSSFRPSTYQGGHQ